MGKSSVIIECKDCGENKIHEAKGVCKQCYSKSQREKHKTEYNAYSKQYRVDNKSVLSEKKSEYIKANREHVLSGKRESYHKNKVMVYNKNKECALFLGVHVAERILSHVFESVDKMPNGNIGYDFICNKGKKIDVKSSCITKKRKNNHSDYWLFHIRKNIIADYFLCISFDNRKDLTPLKLWLIPGMEVQHLSGLTITESNGPKWGKYELDINEVLQCCDTVKETKGELIL